MPDNDDAEIIDLEKARLGRMLEEFLEEDEWDILYLAEQTGTPLVYHSEDGKFFKVTVIELSEAEYRELVAAVDPEDTAS